MKKAFTVLCAMFCFVALFVIGAPLASASPVYANAISLPEFSFSDLMREWLGALVDPATYTTWLHIDGFFHFLTTETFLSPLSSDSYGSLTRESMLGTIPNIFFIVCIITAILCVAVAIIEIRKLDDSKRITRK